MFRILFCETSSYFVSVNMLVFSDVAESKGFDSIARKANGSVDTVDVAACLKGPILKVDVATDTSDLVTQVDQACSTDDLVLQVDAACSTDDLVLQVDAACDTSGLISSRTVATCTEVIQGLITKSTKQEHQNVKLGPTQSTRGLKRKRTPVVSAEPELIEIDRILPENGVTAAQFQEWKPKPLEVERRALILELDKVLMSVRYMQPRRDANQFLEWAVQYFDLFIWSEKPKSDVWKCLARFFPKWRSRFKGQWARENCEQMEAARFKRLSDFWATWPEYNADNTLILDTEHFRHYFNIRRCCLILPEEMPEQYLVQTVSCQLGAWLWTPYRAQYADNICRLVPLTSKSLAVYRRFVDISNGNL